MPFRTAVIGAGPAGLTLARILQLSNHSCTIYELDASPAQRDQGGSLDIHEQSGQLALREARLLEEFKKHARYDAEVLKVMTKDGVVLFDENKSDTRGELFKGRPEIDRIALKKLLINSIEPGTLKWGKKLIDVEESKSEEGKFDLKFEDSTEGGYDIVVGADGAWSKVRPYLTDVKPFYSGVTMVELWALDVEKRKPWLAEFTGKGTLFMFDQDRAILCQRSEQNSRTYAGVRKPESWIADCGIDWTNHELARKRLIEEYFADCAEHLKRAIWEADDRLIVRPLWMLPIGMHWNHRPGVTLVGDAAHLMTPFAGVGVNLAMVDAMELAKAIIGSGGDKGKLDDALRQFEQDMFVRGEQSAKKTWAGLENHFTLDGSKEFAQMLKESAEAASEATANGLV